MILSQLANIDWWQILDHLWHLVIAYALAIPIGLDREKSKRHFELRTLDSFSSLADSHYSLLFSSSSK